MYGKNSHCSYCGHAFAENQPWPRLCEYCGHKSYLNPTPVAVTLLPVDDGLLLVRRAIPPRLGMLALPGGFINMGESWQQAGARELFEETGIQVDAGKIEEFVVLSAPEGMVLIFGLAPAISSADLPAFVPNAETAELVTMSNPGELAFPLHTEAMRLFFARKAVPSKV